MISQNSVSVVNSVVVKLFFLSFKLNPLPKFSIKKRYNKVSALIQLDHASVKLYCETRISDYVVLHACIPVNSNEDRVTKSSFFIELYVELILIKVHL